jgi:hypothetical protein
MRYEMSSIGRMDVSPGASAPGGPGGLEGRDAKGTFLPDSRQGVQSAGQARSPSGIEGALNVQFKRDLSSFSIKNGKPLSDKEAIAIDAKAGLTMIVSAAGVSASRGANPSTFQ